MGECGNCHIILEVEEGRRRGNGRQEETTMAEDVIFGDNGGLVIGGAKWIDS